MCHLERAMEWLRPSLLASETWDYCVLWKVSVNGGSRSIDWISCCCVGGTVGESCINSPTGDGEQPEPSFPALCRDTFNPHSATKTSCLALSQLPFSMTLQSGIHEQVIVSSQARWINLHDKLSPKASQDTIGTRVLIPVLGGLVELFSTKQMPENQGIMDLITAEFNVSSNVSFTDDSELFLGDCTDSWMHYFQQSDFKPLMSELLSFPKLEGSSSGSIPSCLGLGSLSQNSSPKQQLETFSSLEGVNDDKHLYQFKQTTEINSGCDTCVTEKEVSNVCHIEDGQQINQEEKTEQQFKSKNLAAERKRRAKIKQLLWELRSLVPKITKMSQSAVLDDAIDHIVELKTKVKDLQEELHELDRDGCISETESKLCGSNEIAQVSGKLDTSKHGPGSNHSKFHQVQVEVNQLTRSHFLVRILCKAKVGAFTKLLEILEILDLHVTEVNFTSCKGISSNSFMVQANNGEIEAGELRDALIKLAHG